MLYNKIFDQSDRIKTLAFNARTVGNLPHNHPIEIFKPLPKEKEKAIHLIHTEKKSCQWNRKQNSDNVVESEINSQTRVYGFVDRTSLRAASPYEHYYL